MPVPSQLRPLIITLLLLLVWAPAVAQPAAAPDDGKPSPGEIEMGKQAAAQIDKEMKAVEDPAALDRLNRIITRIEPYTQRPAIEYHVKVVMGNDINAFSLPGGYLYVTQPLLQAVESEDELAAVIAHEMAHVSLKHGLELAKREAKMNSKATLAVLAAVLAGKNSDPGNLLMIASLVRTGLLNGYGQQAEMEADANAVLYLQKAGYQPVAMLTVIEGLARIDLSRADVELGIFKTHPDPGQRERAIRAQLQTLGIAMNTRAVLGTLRTAWMSTEKNGRTIARVTLDSFTLFEPAVNEGDLTPQRRAEKMAGDLQRLIFADLDMYDLRTEAAADHAAVTARGVTLIRVLPGDAEFHGTTMADLAAKAAASIKSALWQEAVRRAY